MKQIEHFFSHYKDLEPGKWAKIHHWGDAAEARRQIELASRAGERRSQEGPLIEARPDSPPDFGESTPAG